MLEPIAVTVQVRYPSFPGYVFRCRVITKLDKEVATLFVEHSLGSTSEGNGDITITTHERLDRGFRLSHTGLRLGESKRPFGNSHVAQVSRGRAAVAVNSRPCPAASPHLGLPNVFPTAMS